MGHPVPTAFQVSNLSFQVSLITLSILNAVLVNSVPFPKPRPFFFDLLFGNSNEPEYLSRSDEITAADYLNDDIAPEDFSARPPSEARSIDAKRFPFLSQLLFILYEGLGRNSDRNSSSS